LEVLHRQKCHGIIPYQKCTVFSPIGLFHILENQDFDAASAVVASVFWNLCAVRAVKREREFWNCEMKNGDRILDWNIGRADRNNAEVGGIV
jgi:hypothetical protein